MNSKEILTKNIEAIKDHFICHQSLAYNSNDLTSVTLYKSLRELQELSLTLVNSIELIEDDVEKNCLEDLIKYLQSIKSVFLGPEATPQSIAVELVKGYRQYKTGEVTPANIDSDLPKTTVQEFLEEGERWPYFYVGKCTDSPRKGYVQVGYNSPLWDQLKTKISPLTKDLAVFIRVD